ncbi:hypothetical protein [Paludisphaera rhizosphaerae]|uniref:hypothetical protein n=1 Tax=Paludisphaera rhizosphaerae TaxID=2711216 RepID=UPI0013EE3BAD|nr:hypothetical protein [Paludisphaera rhizosphaerae]
MRWFVDALIASHAVRTGVRLAESTLTDVLADETRTLSHLQTSARFNEYVGAISMLVVASHRNRVLLATENVRPDAPPIRFRIAAEALRSKVHDFVGTREPATTEVALGQR